MPILEGILIKAEGDHLQLVATDLEMSIECRVPAQVETEGSVVLDAKTIGPIVRKLPGDQLVYNTDEHGLARVQGGRSRFTVHTMSADDFPALPDVPAEQMWRLGQGTLKRMIRHTVFAAAVDDARPFLTGVCVEVEGNEIRLIATDSSRLAFHKGSLLNQAERPGSGIVPARALVELTRILDNDSDAEVELLVTESQAVFRVGGIELISRVIEGQFPAYRRVFPEDQPVTMRVDRQELLGAVERVSLIARRNTPVAKLTVSEGTLSLNSSESETGQAFEELDVDHQGEDGEAAYQTRYLIEALRAMDCDEVAFKLGEGLKQGSIAPVDDDNYLYIVMPVRVG